MATKKTAADTCGHIELPESDDENNANTAGWVAETKVRERKKWQHFRTEQLSQGVLVSLCKMFARVTVEQVSIC